MERKRSFFAVASPQLALLLTLTVVFQTVVWAQPPAAQSNSDVVVLNGEGFTVVWPAPSKPNGFSEAMSSEVVTIIKKVTCLSQQDAGNTLRHDLFVAPRDSASWLEIARAWYRRHQDDACTGTSTSNVGEKKVVVDPKWYLTQPKEQNWKVLNDVNLIAGSTPATAGLYRGLLYDEMGKRITSPGAFGDALKKVIADPLKRSRLEGYISKSHDPDLTSCQLAKFTSLLESGTFTSVRMAAAYYANNRRDGVLSDNFAYAPEDPHHPLLAARVLVPEIKGEPGCEDTDARNLDLLQACLNVAPPVEEFTFGAKGYLFIIPPRPEPPVISLVKTASASPNGPFREVATVSGELRQDTVYFQIQARNAGPGTSTGNLLCDPSVDGLVPDDAAALQLASSGCMQIKDIPPQTEIPVTARYRITTANFSRVTQLENVVRLTNITGQRAEARAYVVYVPLPKPTIQQAPCVADCFKGSMSTNLILALRAGTQLKIQYNPDEESVLTLKKSLDRSNRKLVGKLTKITLWEMDTSLGADNPLRSYYHTGELAPGEYWLTTTNKKTGVVCETEIWVPKNPTSWWGPFIEGVFVGAGVSVLVGGVTHVAVFSKPLGQALGGLPRPL
jgi:hypothetical protein